MSRIRSIHPGIYTDDAYMNLTMAARELVKGLWCEADDNGIFEWKPATIKARIFPADNLVIGELLDELVAGGFIRDFSHAGKRYGAVRNFLKYQRPRRPSAVHPLPDNAAVYLCGQPTTLAKAADYAGDGAPLSGGDDLKDDVFPTMSGMSPQMEDGGSKEGSVSSNELTGAEAPSDDPKRELYRLGKIVLGRSSGGQVTKLIRYHDGDLFLAGDTLRLAAKKEAPAEYVGAILRGDRAADTDWDAVYQRMGILPSEYNPSLTH